MGIGIDLRVLEYRRSTLFPTTVYGHGGNSERR